MAVTQTSRIRVAGVPLARAAVTVSVSGESVAGVLSVCNRVLSVRVE